MSFEDVEERDGLYYTFFPGRTDLILSIRRSAVVERLAFFSHRGQSNGGSDCSALHPVEAERRSSSCAL